MTTPWMKFYPTDWRSDPALRMCTLAARGLWLDMLCIMHEAHPYGQLLINGHSPTDTQLGVLIGASPDQITALLGELASAGVFSRTSAGVIYSRKMSRMRKKALTARNNGRKGGNPSLGKEREKPPLDNPPLNPGVNPEVKTQKLEARKKKRNTNVFPKKARQFPVDWMPSESAIEYCISKQFDQTQIGQMVEDCTNHHRSKGSTFKDLDAAFRTWASNQIKFHGHPDAQRRKASGKSDTNPSNSGMAGDATLDAIAIAARAF